MQLERQTTGSFRPYPVLATHVSRPHRTFPHPLMIIRHRGTSSLWLLLLLISAASSQQPDAECHLSIGDDMYDFSSLGGDHTISRSRSLPPTNMTDTLRFNVCKELSLLEGVSPGDQVRIRNIPKFAFTDDLLQCGSGTWACLSKTNIKQGESDRVVAVIPIAQEATLREEHSKLSCAFVVTMVLGAH